MRKEYRLRAFKNRMLSRIFGPKREEVKKDYENCTLRSFMICTPHQVLSG